MPGKARQTTRSAAPGGSAAIAARRPNRVTGLAEWWISTASLPKSGSSCACSRLRISRAASRLEALRIRVNRREKRCTEEASAADRPSSATNSTSGASCQMLVRTAANVRPRSCAAAASTGTTRAFQEEVASVVGQRWPNVESASAIGPRSPRSDSCRWVSSTCRESTPPVKKIAVRSPGRRSGSRNPSDGSIATSRRGGPNQSRTTPIARPIPSARRGLAGPSIAMRRSPSRIAGSAQAARNASGEASMSSAPSASASKRSTTGSRAESSQTTRAEALTTEDSRSSVRFWILTAAPGWRAVFRRPRVRGPCATRSWPRSCLPSRSPEWRRCRVSRSRR